MKIIKQTIYLFLGIILLACQNDKKPFDNIDDNQTISEIENYLLSEGFKKTILGAKLENPYSVENMKKALQNIYTSSGGRTGNDIEVETTHYYVRFFIESTEQFEQLEADSLELFEFPLDYEIQEYGDYYFDADIDPSDGQWFYTRVPVDYIFGAIEHEVLEELFLYEQNEEENGARRSFSREDYFTIEDESLRLTGNLTVNDNDSNEGRIEALRHPQGTILVQNTELGVPLYNFVPVVGVKVMTRRWFSWGFGYTNENGFYRINEDYRDDVNYRINFKNISGFRIWNTMVDIDEASHDGPKTSHHGWNLNISQGMRSWRFATVNNATVRYRVHAQQLGIGQPHSDLRIAAIDKTGDSAAPMLRRTWGLYGFTGHSQLGNYLLKSTGTSLSLNLLALVQSIPNPIWS